MSSLKKSDSPKNLNLSSSNSKGKRLVRNANSGRFSEINAHIQPVTAKATITLRQAEKVVRSYLRSKAEKAA